MNDRSTFDQDNILYIDLSNSSLKNAISGSIYKLERSDNSKLEDIVINSIAITHDDAQLGVSNVNIHIPPLEVSIKDVTTGLYNKQWKPNHKRMQALAAIASTILKNGNGADYNYWIESQTTVNNPSTNERFLNFRINFKLHKY
jgi:hypothetical protein